MTLGSPLSACLRATSCLGLFLCGLSAACWALREALPFPEVPSVSEKLRHLAEHHDEYDTLFLGSSRIHHQIIPSLFDECAAEEGLPTKSFNAGIAGMLPVENGYFLDQILRYRPKNLRWVFIELSDFRLTLPEEKKQTLRAQYWHDWPRLILLFQRAFYLKPVKKKRDTWERALTLRREPMILFLEHFRLFARRQTNLGRGTMLASRLISSGTPAARRRSLERALGDRLDGWIPWGGAEEITPANRAVFDRELADRREKPAFTDLADPVSQQALEIMIAKVEKLGGRVVLLVPPTTARKNFYPRPERQSKNLLLDFSDLERFPELYEHRHRIDAHHLNIEGAKIWTRLLVRRWAAGMKAQREGP